MQINPNTQQAVYSNQQQIVLPEDLPFFGLVYFFLGPDCYFSAINRSVSLTMGAEEVIRAIAAKENIDPREVHWFSLKTPAGCPNLVAGQYELEHLVTLFESWDEPAYPAETLEWRDPDGELLEAMIFPARPLFRIIGRELLPCPRWLRFFFYRFIFVN